MKIVVDENIPWARDAFGAFGELVLKPGRSIARADLLDADALIVRSVTRVDAGLLDGTSVRFVGTATIGVDHVDDELLAARGIAFASAAGSNAESVAEWVIAAVLALWGRSMADVAGASFGVLGVGDVGGRVARDAAALGMRVVLYDPPRHAAEEAFVSASLDELLACDVVSVHVPLVQHGEHPTHCLIDASMIDRMGPATVLINSSRGGVIDTAALVDALRAGRLRAAALDVWEAEPDVPVDLITACAIATPHIAGYAIDAKARGTMMMVEALGTFCGREVTWRGDHVLEPRAGIVCPDPRLGVLGAIGAAVEAAYPILRDDRALRDLLDRSAEERRAGFDRLRRDYPERREFAAFSVRCDDPAVVSLASALGFSTGRGEGSTNGS